MARGKWWALKRGVLFSEITWFLMYVRLTLIIGFTNGRLRVINATVYIDREVCILAKPGISSKRHLDFRIYRVFISGSYKDVDIKRYAEKIIEIVNDEIEKYGIRFITWYTPRHIKMSTFKNQPFIDRKLSESQIFLGVACYNFGEYTEHEWYKALYGLTKLDTIPEKYRDNCPNYDFGEVFYFNYKDLRKNTNSVRIQAFERFVNVASNIETEHGIGFLPIKTFSLKKEEDFQHYELVLWSNIGFALKDWAEEQSKDSGLELIEPIVRSRVDYVAY